MLAPLLVLVTGCGPVHRSVVTVPPEPQAAYHQAVDWSSAGDEAVHALQEYLRIDTSNPPGNETEGARYLAAVLQREGIETEIIEYTEGRGSLIARVRGSGEEPPLCLMSHIDVATAEAEHWPPDKGPFSGVIDEDGVLWGRGALDMKGMGAIEVMTMVWLARLDVPLRRDVILLAVADEEVGNHGARHVIEERWDELGCSHMINEGGFGVPDVLFDGQTIFGISTAEKGVLWLEVVAHGDPGHGSNPVRDQAPEHLVTALRALDERKVEPRYHPAMLELFYQVGMDRKGIERAILTRPDSVRSLLRGMLMGNPTTQALLTNTIHLTGLKGAAEPNVVPSEARAQFDCRSLPGVDPMVILEELQELFDHDPRLSYDVVLAKEGNDSPLDDPLYAIIAHHAVGDRDDAVAGPIVSPGFTDSIFYRDLGVHAYGLIPFECPAEELETMHGHHERVTTANVAEGLRKLFAIVTDFCAEPGGAVPAEPMVAPAWVSPTVEPAQEEHPVPEHAPALDGHEHLEVP